MVKPKTIIIMDFSPISTNIFINKDTNTEYYNSYCEMPKRKRHRKKYNKSNETIAFNDYSVISEPRYPKVPINYKKLIDESYDGNSNFTTRQAFNN